MKKVSVVIPCYNVEEYIGECLDSLCRQTYPNIEIICVDDGSSDRTVDVILQYCKADNRISLLQQEHQYAGIARNNGLKKASGEYICFLDGDDFFQNNMIEKMLKIAEQYDTDIVLCNANHYDNITKEITAPLHRLKIDYLNNVDKVFSYKNIPDKILSIGGAVPWNKLYKVQFIREKNLSFQEIKRCNDEYFVGMSMVLADRISYVNERFVFYRVNNDISLQGYAENDTSFDFYKALLALHEGLIKAGVYEQVQIDYVNKALQSCKIAMERQNNVNNFMKLYSFIKEEAFEQLEITSTPKEKIYSEKEFYEEIKAYDAIEYLFHNLKKMQKSKGERYLFPYEAIGNCKKIAIYAMGEVGTAFYRQLINHNYYQVVVCFDSNFERLQAQGYAIIDPKRIQEYKFDKIVVAIKDGRLFGEIEQLLLGYGVEKNKIVWGCQGMKN